MTRKDYELISGVFADFSKVCEIEETIGGSIARELATELEIENPRFNRARFLSACGVKVAN